MTRTEPRSEANNRDDILIRPFAVKFPQSDLDDLHRRVRETRWPEREIVDDASQGVQLDVVKALAERWVGGHNWRAVEARLNELPQFVTRIDGVDIHFIHVRSQHEDALPMIGSATTATSHRATTGATPSPSRWRSSSLRD